MSVSSRSRPSGFAGYFTEAGTWYDGKGEWWAEVLAGYFTGVGTLARRDTGSPVRGPLSEFFALTMALPANMVIVSREKGGFPPIAIPPKLRCMAASHPERSRYA